MARLQAGIGLCLLCFFVLTSAAFTKENILGTVRLRENRLIFQSPSTATTANRYVTVDCPSGFLEKPAPTTNVIQPLATARFGETLTIVEISECKYTNGEHFAGHFVQVRTSQGIIGFTQLPNYHNVVVPANDTGAVERLFLDETDCGNDPECYVKHALPYREFIRDYPPSVNTGIAANAALWDYLVAAKLFLTLASNPEFLPEVSARYAQYDRKTLAEKARASLELKDQMHAIREKNIYPSLHDSSQVSFWIVVIFLLFLFVCWWLFVRQLKEYIRLKNIDGLESWSLDDIEFRLHELRRFQNSGGINFFRKSHKIEDAIFRLKQNEERKRHEDTPPDTIIGIVIQP